MTLPPVDQARRQALALAQANANPNASFAERVAQFDQLAQISQKRKVQNEKETVNEESYLISASFSFTAKNDMPQDVLTFLEEIFSMEMSQWKYDPGYATRVTSSCPPPTNSKLLVSAGMKERNHLRENR
jgi:hypothetical protein